MQAVLGLVEHHRLRPVDDLGRHLFPAMRGQAVHEDRLRRGRGHHLFRHTEALEGGEPGLFADGPRTANVEAMTPCIVWALRLPRFEELGQRVPAVALEALRAAGAVMATRLRANMARQMPVT